MFSRSTQYAIRAMTFLAMQPSGKLTGAREIAGAEKIPMPFLWKILQLLTRRKLIRSFKGFHGGYELACPAGEITLLRLVLATDGERVTNSCVLGLPQCEEENSCPLHVTWKEIRSRMNAMLEQNTLQDLAKLARRRARKGRANF